MIIAPIHSKENDIHGFGCLSEVLESNCTDFKGHLHIGSFFPTRLRGSLFILSPNQLSSSLRETALCKVRDIFQLTVAYDAINRVGLCSVCSASLRVTVCTDKAVPTSRPEVLLCRTFMSQKAANFTFSCLFWVLASCKYDFPDTLHSPALCLKPHHCRVTACGHGWHPCQLYSNSLAFFFFSLFSSSGLLRSTACLPWDFPLKVS